jgi:hypothetical protein
MHTTTHGCEEATEESSDAAVVAKSNNVDAKAAANTHSTTPSRTSEPRVCCMALTAQCLSCAEGMELADYCTLHPTSDGCSEKTSVGAAKAAPAAKVDAAPTSGGATESSGVTRASASCKPVLFPEGASLPTYSEACPSQAAAGRSAALNCATKQASKLLQVALENGM